METKASKPLKRSKRKTKCPKSNSEDEKKWKYTSDEITAIPAQIFPKFGEMAKELQTLIWTSALTQPTVIECVYRPNLKHFWALGSKKAIQDVTSLGLAAHLKLAQEWEQGWQPEWGPRRKNKKPVRFQLSERIYIHPNDIVYIPEIHTMDVDTFINQKSSHIIENLAIHAGVALGLNKASVWAFFDASPAGKLIRGLPNLKTLHIVEGGVIGAETSVTRTGKHKLSLEEIKECEDTAVKYSSGAVNSEIQHPWNSSVAESIRKMFMEKIPVEDAVEQYKKFKPGWTWQIPELHFHKLKREIVKK